MLCDRKGHGFLIRRCGLIRIRRFYRITDPCRQSLYRKSFRPGSLHFCRQATSLPIKSEMIGTDPQHILPVIQYIRHSGLVPYHNIVHDVGGRSFPSILFRIESRTTYSLDIHQITVVTQQGKVLVCRISLGSSTFQVVYPEESFLVRTAFICTGQSDNDIRTFQVIFRIILRKSLSVASLRGSRRHIDRLRNIYLT